VGIRRDPIPGSAPARRLRAVLGRRPTHEPAWEKKEGTRGMSGRLVSSPCEFRAGRGLRRGASRSRREETPLLGPLPTFREARKKSRKRLNSGPPASD
jgi:hypothetical protein